MWQSGIHEKKKIFEIYHTCKVTDPQYLRIRFCDVRAARAVRRAWSSQGWTGHIEHFPRRAKVAFSVPPHVQVRREGFYSWHSSSGGRQARDVYWTKEKINTLPKSSIKIFLLIIFDYPIWSSCGFGSGGRAVQQSSNCRAGKFFSLIQRRYFNIVTPVYCLYWFKLIYI